MVGADSRIESCLFENIYAVAFKLKASSRLSKTSAHLMKNFFSLAMLIVALLLIGTHRRPSLLNLRLDIMTPMVVSWLPAQNVLLVTLLFSSLNTKLIMTCWSL